MKVFISWSGERSKAVAEALHNWLKEVVQSVDPWISSEDIRKGKRWGVELAQQLESTQVGVICLTPENLTAPWLLFEAGALSKLLKDAYVFTYLIGVEPTAVTGPLAEFQHTTASKDETHKMVKTINSTVDEQRRLPDNLLDRAFNRCWPELEQQLNTLPALQGGEPPPRKAEDMLQEVLEIVRDLAKSPPLPSARTLGGVYRRTRDAADISNTPIARLSDLAYLAGRAGISYEAGVATGVATALKAIDAATVSQAGTTSPPHDTLNTSAEGQDKRAP